MTAFEAMACGTFDSVIAVSRADKLEFEKLYDLSQVETIPTGVDTKWFAPMPDRRPKANSLVFCGSMDWLPNEDAIRFFVESVLPRVRREVPDTVLTVVGRNPSPRLSAAVAGREDVVLTGWVEDTRPWLADSGVCVVPIRIGGGTRLKIYEAMAMALPVVSTRVGAEGLDVSDGDNIILADDADAQAGAIVELLRDADRRLQIGQAARRHVDRRYSWPRVAEVFQGICERTVARARRSREAG